MLICCNSANNVNIAFYKLSHITADTLNTKNSDCAQYVETREKLLGLKRLHS